LAATRIRAERNGVMPAERQAHFERAEKRPGLRATLTGSAG
jgi:hypothetical protein